MINPDKITDYNRTPAELQEFLLFCIAVAGHNAHTTALALDRFLELNDGPVFDARHRGDLETPFQYIGRIADKEMVLEDKIRVAGIGCYNMVAKSWRELIEARLDIATCSLSDLEKIHKIGPKTSRFFMLHSRPNICNVAVIDRHILSFLKSNGLDVPKTLTHANYLRLEKQFIELAEKSGMSLADFDLEVWKAHRRLPTNNAMEE